MDDEPIGTRPRPLTPSGRLFGRSLFPPATPEQRVAALSSLFFEGDQRRPYLERFAVLIVLSTSIASLGLMQDSAAVVIGAMVVAPLMNPILALAAAVVHGWTRRALEAAATVAGGVALAVATGWLSSRVGGSDSTRPYLPGELLARTGPGLLDLGVAIAAGAAGGYVLARPEANSALPGVGIAVALVPPLGAVGVCLELNEGDLATGAFLLFTTNLASIVLAAALVFIGVGMVSPDVRRLATPKIRRGLALSAGVVVVVAIPLTRHTWGELRDDRLVRATVDGVAAWDPEVKLVELHADDTPSGAMVEVRVSGVEPPEPAWLLADEISARVGRPVEVVVDYRPETRSEAGVSGPPGEGRLVVFTNYLDRDLARFESVMDTFAEASGHQVQVVGSGSFEDDLAGLVAAGEAPDVALVPQPGLLRRLAADGELRVLPARARDATADVAPALTELVTVEGEPYAAWFRLTDKSLVWYRPSVLEPLGAVPTTWSELEALTERARQEGLAPWCLSMADGLTTGWVGTDWVEQFLVLAEGPDAYADWVAGDIAFTDPRVGAAFEAFGAIASDPRQVAGGPRRVLAAPVTQAGDPLRADPPGCLLLRQGNGLPGAPTGTSGVEGELAAFPLPPRDAAVGAPAIVAGEAAVALSDADGVDELMVWLASAEAGAVWAADGGFVSPHADLAPDAYGDRRDREADEHLRTALAGDGVVFDGSDLMSPELGTDRFWAGVTDYVRGEPLDEVLVTIAGGP